MGKTARITLILVSIVVFVGIPLLIALRIWDAADSGSSTAERHFARIVTLTREHSEKLDRDAPEEFASAIGPEVRQDERLVTLVVAEGPGRIDYAWSRFRHRLPHDLDALEAGFRLETTPPWERSYDRNIVTPDGNRITISTVYTVLSRNVVFQFLRDGLLAVLAFALLVLVALIASLRPPASIESNDSPKTDTHHDDKRSTVSDTSGRENKHDAHASASVAQSTQQPPLVSPASGLSYATHLERRLARELERAAENDLNLSLLFVRITDNNGRHIDEKLLGTLVLEHFPFEDLVFEYADGTACAVLPGYELDAALRKAERMWTLLRRHDLGAFHARVGASSRNGRLVEAERIINEAFTALEKADSKSNIVGFQPDPDRYRRYIASKLEA